MHKIVLTLLITGSMALAADWPQWRGPERDDHSSDTGLLHQWPKEGPRLLWKTDGLGAGYSTVSIVGDRIFTAGDGPDSSLVHALSSEGKVIWSSKLGRPGEAGGYVGPRAQPTVDEGAVFMLGQFGDLVCYDAATGKETWRKNLSKDFGGERGGWGYAESVLVDGDNVICTPGGRKGTMLALNRKTGEQVWRTTDLADKAEYVSAVVATIGGVKQYVQMTGNSVFGVSPVGKLLWRAERRGITATIPTPVVYNDHVYVTSGYGVGCSCFKISKQVDEFKAEQVYKNRIMVDHHGGVVRVGDYLYGHSDGNGWVCQKFDTGELVWKTNSVGKGSLTFADGQLYLRSEGGAGRIALVDATPEGYREHGRFEQPQRSNKNSWPHPVVINGRLYIRDQEWLLCYEVK